MKNEAPFLLEWLAYHKLIGFDRIVIYSNDSDDGTTELLDALADAGEIEHRLQTVPEGVGPQKHAAMHANSTDFLQPGDWMLWLDADEFLNIHAKDGTLPDLLEVIGDRDGMLLQWRIFGDGGNTRFPGRFISADFTTASALDFENNREIKMLFRVTDRVAGLCESTVNRPLLKPLPDNSSEMFLNGNGKPIYGGFQPTMRWLAGEDVPRSRFIGKHDLGWDVAQVNHYIVRTPEHFALKKTRGRGWAGPDGKTPARHNLRFYREVNQNDHSDRSILRFTDQVTAGIARLRLNLAVARAEFNAQYQVNKRIAAMLSAEQHGSEQNGALQAPLV